MKLSLRGVVIILNSVELINVKQKIKYLRNIRHSKVTYKILKNATHKVWVNSDNMKHVLMNAVIAINETILDKKATIEMVRLPIKSDIAMSIREERAYVGSMRNPLNFG